jgi:hypothetical protein
MRLKFLIITLLMLIFSPKYTQAQPSQDSSTLPVFSYKKDFKNILDSTMESGTALYYNNLLDRFLKNDSTLSKYETLALMIGFTENSYYKPLEDMEIEQEIFDLNMDGQYQEAFDKAVKYLQNHPVSLLVNREASFASQKISKAYQNQFIMDTAVMYQDSAIYFMALNDKLMEAMIYSGKGRTAETPIFSLGMADGEHFIPNVGYEIESKDTEWNRNGDFLEVITAIDNLTTKKFYFVIQHAKLKIDDDKADELAEKNAKKKSKKKGDKEKKLKQKKTTELPKEEAPPATPVQ